MDRWKQSIHEFIVIAWLPKYSSWSITWHSGVRDSIQREYNVKISEAILRIEDWMTWRSETLDDCWLPNSWSLALLDSWSKASMPRSENTEIQRWEIEAGVQRELVYQPDPHA